MSELPEEKLKLALASVGCDFFGPFVIKGEVQKRIRGKCFGVIFTCLVSRAVHVDISNSYSMDSFLQALRRFSRKKLYLTSMRNNHKILVFHMVQNGISALPVLHG